jgi:hypothetical protein
MIGQASILVRVPAPQVNESSTIIDFAISSDRERLVQSS